MRAPLRSRRNLDSHCIRSFVYRRGHHASSESSFVSLAEVITEPEKDPESDFQMKTGPGAGVGISVFYKSRIVNFIKFIFSLNG